MTDLTNSPLVSSLRFRVALLMGVFLLAIGATLQAGAGIMPALLMAVLGALSLLVIRSHARRLEESRISFGHNEDYIEGIARLSSDIHLLLDIEEGRFLYLSEAVSETLGYPQETFLSGGLEHLLTLVHPEDVHLVQAHFQRLESTRRPPPYTLSNEPMEELSFRIRDNHGAWRWFRCRRLVLKREIDGQPGTLLAVLRDVSEQWALDAAIVQAQKLGTTSTLIRGTVHDLNNALMAIHGFTEILLAGPEATGPLRQDLAAILSAADRATGLCGKLAVYGGPGRIRIGRISLNGLIMDSLSHLESLVPDSVELETILEPSLPEIHGDEDQVRHALLSVLIHSVETLGSQGGAITLRTFHSGQQVFLQVEDQGQGLPKPVLDHLFDPQAMPGRGYGLAVVRNIAQEHGGGITVESQSGTGTTYKINFPATPDQRESSEAGLSDLSGDSRLILVVDDDASIRSVLRHGLEGEGYRVLEAEDGVVGFGAFLRHRKAISLVLLDLTMPRMGGQEVLEKMHRLSPGTPVVLMSGYSREEATAAFEGKGLAGFLPKPCKLREALNVVQEVLSHQEEGALKCD